MLRSIFSTGLLASIAIAAPTDASAATPSCTLLSIPVTISKIAQKNLTGPLDHSKNPGEAYADFPDSSISGTFDISASYCQATTQNSSRSNSLQILVSGATYNKTYWSGLETPPQSFNGTVYSWVDFATSQGYDVLAIDRICNGNSSLPDGANVCQVQTSAATIHGLVQQARAGTLIPGASKKFSTIIYVGNSVGSELGSYYANTYTSDLSALILTGFSAFSDAYLGFSTGLQPAKDASPKFSSFTDPTYLAIFDPRTVRGYFYFGSFNPTVAALDFQGIGTVTFGELLSYPLGKAEQPNVTIPVFIMNGQNDQLRCPVTAVGGFFASGGDCGSGSSSLTAQTLAMYYPNAKSGSSFFNVPNTGLSINLHYSAPQSYDAAQKWLTSIGL